MPSIDPRSRLPTNQRRQRVTHNIDADPNEVVGLRNVPRRTNWRNRSICLSVNTNLELRHLEYYHRHLMSFVPFASFQSYNYLLILFIASQKNQHLRALFRTGRISIVMQTINNITVAPILRQADSIRAIFFDRLAIQRWEIRTQLVLNYPPINRTIDSLL